MKKKKIIISILKFPFKIICELIKFATAIQIFRTNYDINEFDKNIK